MPTVFTHAAVPLTLAVLAGTKRISPRLLLAGIATSALPDADVLAFRWGIEYAAPLGHRGISHSLVFALLLGLLAASLAKPLKADRKTAFWFVALAAASHGLLDMLTNGGLGVALWWPVSAERYFLPWRMIEVSPLSLTRFLGEAGLRVLRSEFFWIWLPALSVCGVAWVVRALRSKQGDRAA